MGFLNHATNNIIIDAVLTERGRELLSRNDGSFNITAFSFGDDEVDYSLIDKYGLPIGKEKIEKNTPVFEANPNESVAIKYPLLTFTNPVTQIDKFPSLIWDRAEGLSEITLVDSSASSEETFFEITVKNSVVANSDFVLNTNLTDNQFFIKVNNDLLKIENMTPIDIDQNGIALYRTTTSAVTSGKTFSNQISKTFKIHSNNVISSAFTKYTSLSSDDEINTSVQVIGASSGKSVNIDVKITQSS